MSTSNRMMLDEFWRVADASNDLDRIRHQLRNIAGIPNATYLTSLTRVFVFEKLVRLVSEDGLDPSVEADIHKILELSQHAWVCPREAVLMWAVRPVGYRLEKDGVTGAWVIRHECFNAVIPISFLSATSAQEAFASLLMGEVVGHFGTMFYHSQPLVTQDGEMQSLPPIPVMDVPLTPPNKGSRWLKMGGWHPGHSLIGEDVYEQARLREAVWKDSVERMSTYVSLHMEDLSPLVAALDLQPAADMPYPLESHELAQAQQLAELYPELSSMTSAWIWHKLESFSRTQGYRSIIESRDDRLILFLLGQLCVPTCSDYEAEDVGALVAYSLLQGVDIANASASAREMSEYSTLLTAQCMYIQRAVTHLRQDEYRRMSMLAIQASRPLHEMGLEIKTIQDTITQERRYGAKGIQVVQSCDDLKIA